MSLSPEFLDMLRCVESRAALIHFPSDDGDGYLFCPSSRLRYRIDGGIPVMLLEEAERVDDAERDNLLARARDLGLSIPE